jgi:hypothetical protein
MLAQRTFFVLVAGVVLGCRDQRAVSVEPDLTQPLSPSEWAVDGTGSWAVGDGKLTLVEAGIPGGPIRRPAALAILESEMLQKASVRAQIRSAAPVEVSQRDLQVIVGYQSPSRFYYVHLAGLTDGVHNGIFLVADADRRRIDDGQGVPQLRDQEWHDVRVEWDSTAGTIEVFVDGSAAPVLTARDTTITAGRVGFGSFDDTGEFRAIHVTGVAAVGGGRSSGQRLRTSDNKRYMRVAALRAAWAPRFRS